MAHFTHMKSLPQLAAQHKTRRIPAEDSSHLTAAARVAR